MKTAIIGTGISGLSVARMLSEKHEVCLFEREAAPGGLCRCKKINGTLFHLTGGHCFNSKRQDVLDWFWSQADQDHFNKVARNAVVALSSDLLVKYPIENHIYEMPEAYQKSIINELISRQKQDVANFDDFLRLQFGETLYHLYFKPYNEKIWQRSLKDVPLTWLEGKLPMPSVPEIMLANFNHADERSMVHSVFYASKGCGSQDIVDLLSRGLQIKCNCHIDSMRYQSKKWIIMDECFDRVVFCGNSLFLPHLVKGLPSSSVNRLSELEYHGTTSVLCVLDENPYTWIYMPDRHCLSHRIICTGNYWQGNNGQEKMTGVIEFSQKLSQQEIHGQLAKIPFHPRYLAHHYAEFSYPVQTGKTKEIINSVKKELEPCQFFLLGRFAEWEYYNMDAAMGAALDLVQHMERS